MRALTLALTLTRHEMVHPAGTPSVGLCKVTLTLTLTLTLTRTSTLTLTLTLTLTVTQGGRTPVACLLSAACTSFDQAAYITLTLTLP